MRLADKRGKRVSAHATAHVAFVHSTYEQRKLVRREFSDSILQSTPSLPDIYGARPRVFDRTTIHSVK